MRETLDTIAVVAKVKPGGTVHQVVLSKVETETVERLIIAVHDGPIKLLKTPLRIMIEPQTSESLGRKQRKEKAVKELGKGKKKKRKPVV